MEHSKASVEKASPPPVQLFILSTLLPFSSFSSFSSSLGETESRYVVMGAGGCVVRTSPDLNSRVVGFLAPGSLVGAPERRIGRRAFVRSPLRGWCSEWSSDGYRIVGPVAGYGWQRWGRTRLHVAACGHAVGGDAEIAALEARQVGAHLSAAAREHRRELRRASRRRRPQWHGQRDWWR